MDEVVLQGQTGLSWIDELLTKRAAQQAELAKLEATLSAATNVNQRVAAHLAIAQFELKQSRPDSSRRLRHLRAVVDVGRDLPQTVEVWRELIQRAQNNDSSRDVGTLLNSFVAAVKNLPKGSTQLTRLLDAWRLSKGMRRQDVSAPLLEQIQRDYPVALEAMEAYEALASHYRGQGNKERLEPVQQSIRDTRDLMIRQSDEMNLTKDLAKALQAKNAAKAEEILFSLTPGLLPKYDYWKPCQDILTIHAGKTNFAATVAILTKGAQFYQKATLTDEQKARLYGSVAMQDILAGRFGEAEKTLAKGPAFGKFKDWRENIEARDWVGGARQQTPRLPQLELIPKANASAPWKSNAPVSSQTAWQGLSMKPQTNLVVQAEPPTQWSAVCDKSALYLEICCDEPEMEKVVAKKSGNEEKGMWDDDCVEIFLAPIKGLAYGQWVVNSKGFLMDALYSPQTAFLPCNFCFNQGWNSEAKARALPFAKGWRVKVMVPWRSVGIKVEDKACFFNLRRQRKVGKKVLFSWAENGFATHNPTGMGMLIFRKPVFQPNAAEKSPSSGNDTAKPAPGKVKSRQSSKGKTKKS